MITRMRLKNFKSWRDTGDVELGKITGIFGKNSSGKSSLIQALLLLKQTSEDNDPAKILRLNSPIDFGSFRELVFGHDPQEALGVEISTDMRALRSFNAEISMENDLLVVRHLEYLLADDFSFGLDRLENGSYKYFSSDGFDDDTQRYPGRFFFIEPHLLRRTDPMSQDRYGTIAAPFQLEQLFKHLHYLGPARPNPSRFYTWSGEAPADVGINGEETVSALLASRTKGGTVEVFVGECLVNLGLAVEFKVETLNEDARLYRIMVQEMDGSPMVSILDVGTGISQVVPCLVLLAVVPEGSLVILEHPELHLHPDAQSRLADVLISAALDRHLQIIVESHSEHLLYRLQRRIAEQAFSAVDAKLYFCRMEKGESKLEKLQIDTYGHITNWPHDFFGNPLHDMAKAARAAAEREEKEHA